MENIDTNIENYSLSELKRFFRISTNDISRELLNSIHNNYSQLIADSVSSVLEKKRLLNFIKTGINKIWYDIKFNKDDLDEKNVIKNGQNDTNGKNTDDDKKNQPIILNKERNEINDLVTNETHFRQHGNHMIINPHPISFNYDGPNQNVGGLINPLERKVIAKQICFDTLLRENYINTESSSFMFTFKEPMKNVISMQLVTIELPRMWHTYSKENENVSMTINMYNLPDTPFVSIPIELPSGNYNTVDFSYTLNNILKDNHYLKYLTFHVDLVSGHTIFALDPTAVDSPRNPISPSYSPIFYYEIIFGNENQDIRSTLGWTMGFRKEKYTVYQEPSVVSHTHTDVGAVVFYGHVQSESTFGANLENYLYFDVDDFNNNYVTNAVTAQNFNTFIGQTILGRIVLGTVPYTIVGNNASDYINRTREYFGPVTITRIKVRLLNKFGFPVNMLHNDYSFVLEFKQLYTH